MVERKRPGGASPIALTPRVEQIATPATVAAPSEPIDQAPQVEAAEGSKPAETATPKATKTRARASQRESTETAAERATASAAADNVMVVRTVRFQESLIRRAETAVFRTGGREGGHPSMVALLNAALERELRRLEEEFNDGVPFPPNKGPFRVGRPVGS